MMQLSPQDPTSESIAARIARVLRDRIVQGALAPGTPVRQDRVAEEFGTSHVPVREAFRVLEGRGLLVSEPRRGVRVAALDRATLIEVTEMRAALESLALKLAFPRIDTALLASATRILDESEASDDVAVLEEANRRFHSILVAPCGMPRLIASIDGLHEASARYLFATWKGLDWRGRSDQEHRQLIACLERRELASAQDTLGRHVREAGYALAEVMGRE